MEMNRLILLRGVAAAALSRKDRVTVSTPFEPNLGIGKAVCTERRRNYAKAQTRKRQLGSLGSRPRLHGNELFLWPAQRQEGDDRASCRRRRSRRHILRYR